LQRVPSGRGPNLPIYNNFDLFCCGFRHRL
jgi:hypothetical protein